MPSSSSVPWQVVFGREAEWVGQKAGGEAAEGVEGRSGHCPFLAWDCLGPLTLSRILCPVRALESASTPGGWEWRPRRVIKWQMKLTVLDAAPRGWTAAHAPTDSTGLSR